MRLTWERSKDVAMVVSDKRLGERGILFVNADDWGRDKLTTDRTLACVERGAVSSVSAMVFMEDSDRAAAIAREQSIDAGLHLNFTTAFSGRNCPARLVEHQRQISGYLQHHRLARMVFNPALRHSFDYVVSAQIDEYRRVYDAEPARFDGHHHMHLCANVLMAGLLPFGAVIRRNFSFMAGEKSWSNRIFRIAQDHWLAQGHQIADYFFPLLPLRPRKRLERIFALAERYTVEVETHPVALEEHDFLMGEEFSQLIATVVLGAPTEILNGGANSQPRNLEHDK